MARRNWAKGRDVANIEIQYCDPITLVPTGTPGFLQGKWREPTGRSGKIMQEDATPTDSIDTDRVDTQFDWTLQIAEMMTNGYGSNILDNFWDTTAGGNATGGYLTPTLIVSIREFGEKRIYTGMAESCDSQRVRGVNSLVLTVNKIATGAPNPLVIQDPGS